MLAMALLLAAAFYFEWIPDLSDTREVRDSIAGFGLLAPVVFILLLSFLNPFFIPILTFVIPGALIWDFKTLLLLTWLGVIGSCINGFFFARFLARDYVSHHLPQRLRAYDERIAESGFRATVIVRLVAGLVPPSHWLFGLSNIKFFPYLLGSALGFAPLTFAVVYTVSIVGSSMGEWLESQPSSTWWLVGGAVASIVAARLFWRRSRDVMTEQG